MQKKEGLAIAEGVGKLVILFTRPTQFGRKQYASKEANQAIA